MRFVSFNANGVRARLHQLKAIGEKFKPHIIAVQEIKVADEQFPLDDVKALGYEHVHYYGQKGHYGVALFARQAPVKIQLGLPWRDADQQRRFIAAVYDIGGARIHVVNGYFPQGESREHPQKFPAKALFYADVLRYLKEHCNPGEHLIVAGDMNVAPGDDDIGIGDENRKRWLQTGKCCFLPEERDWLESLMSWGLFDSYLQHLNGSSRMFSWFDYRSRAFERNPKRGLRIDLIL
ncbi:MAG: exodeoxyribonuclease III, partial [Gammaproteobacteria bacterium]|nr:exodeoxyribonuclease III [Gammaproteobacteria bacterium]